MCSLEQPASLFQTLVDVDGFVNGEVRALHRLYPEGRPVA